MLSNGRSAVELQPNRPSSAFGVFHVMRHINVRYLLTYLLKHHLSQLSVRQRSSVSDRHSRHHTKLVTLNSNYKIQNNINETNTFLLVM